MLDEIADLWDTLKHHFVVSIFDLRFIVLIYFSFFFIFFSKIMLILDHFGINDFLLEGIAFKSLFFLLFFFSFIVQNHDFSLLINFLQVHFLDLSDFFFDLVVDFLVWEIVPGIFFLVLDRHLKIQIILDIKVLKIVLNDLFF